MFKPLIQFVVAHLMQQNSWAAPLLQAHAQTTVCLDFKVARVLLTILENGQLAVAADTAEADATVHLPPALVMRLLRQDPLAHSLIKIEGDAGLATEVSKLLAAMRWDVEADLSRLVGDVAAYEVIRLGKQQWQQMQHSVGELADMLVEYLQEERRWLVGAAELNRFNRAVDEARDHSERLAARVARLQSQTAPDRN